MTKKENACGRVKNMMVLYDKLYRSEDFRAVSAKRHLTTLDDDVTGTVQRVIVGGQSSQWPWRAYIFLIRHESS